MLNDGRNESQWTGLVPAGEQTVTLCYTTSDGKFAGSNLTLQVTTVGPLTNSDQVWMYEPMRCGAQKNKDPG